MVVSALCRRQCERKWVGRVYTSRCRVGVAGAPCMSAGSGSSALWDAAIFALRERAHDSVLRISTAADYELPAWRVSGASLDGGQCGRVG